jgi:hypothetical protein
MRLLPVGSDHGGGGVDARKPHPDRCRHRPGDDEHLPLRLLPPHQVGDQVRGGARMTVALERKDFLRIVAFGGAGLRAEPRTRARVRSTPPHPRQATFVAGRVGRAWAATASPPSSSTKVELGQGIATALPMCVAEELDIPMSSVRFRISPAEPKYYNARGTRMSTGGSRSTPSMSPVMRKAGATARAMLVSAAAAKWNVDPATCTHGERRRFRTGRSAGEVRRTAREPPRRCPFRRP